MQITHFTIIHGVIICTKTCHETQAKNQASQQVTNEFKFEKLANPLIMT